MCGELPYDEEDYTRDTEQSTGRDEDECGTSPALDEELLASLRAATKRSEATVRRLSSVRHEDDDLENDDEPYRPLLTSPTALTDTSPTTALGPACAPFSAVGRDSLGTQDVTKVVESRHALQACAPSELLCVNAVPRLLSAAVFVLAATRFSADQDTSKSPEDLRLGGTDDDDENAPRRANLVSWIARISRAAVCIQTLLAVSPDCPREDRALADRCIDIASRIGTIVASAARAVVVDEGGVQDRFSNKWAGSAFASIVVAGSVSPNDREAIAILRNL